jgi:hypothetical protein
MSSRQSRRLVAGIVSVAAFAIAAVAWAYSGPATITHFSGNIVSCKSLDPSNDDGTFAGNGGSGTYNTTHDGGPSFSVTVTNHGGNPVIFDFSSSEPVSAVIVKVGNGGTIYSYNPPVTSDTGLESRDSSGGPKDSISHLVFCKGEAAHPTAVTAASFAARASAKTLRLSWRMGSEAGALGYNVYRQTAAGKVKLNGKLILAKSSTGAAYSFVARRASGIYLLQQVGASGATRWLARTRVAS